ncbi:hypothetical protein GALMADRAFT_82494 [Galerina marginata CBS 339.88]|uniref:Uncharacterized protein n=1 Tax=Galerina marginata (strain CBS 339.88) TaxID=685588 RepID=A0A067S2G2_GALM3|nr:hypothetical protein GALMADRAFT_82494 [Galerina marginata CBS 339.88]
MGTLPLPPSLPKDCEPAIKNTLDLVKRTALGDRWDRLVSQWLRFERSYKFKGSSRLSTTARPPLIKEWIQRARVSTYSPSIDTAEFRTEFWAWWAVLQPEWRKITVDTTSRLALGGWEALDKPGPNGWPSIVAALFFWGRALHLANRSTSSWKLAVDDVIWVLENLCQLHSA